MNHFSTYPIGRSPLLEAGIGKTPLQQATDDLIANSGLMSPLARLALEHSLSSFPSLNDVAMAQAGDMLRSGSAIEAAAKAALYPPSLTDHLNGL